MDNSNIPREQVLALLKAYQGQQKREAEVRTSRARAALMYQIVGDLSRVLGIEQPQPEVESTDVSDTTQRCVLMHLSGLTRYGKQPTTDTLAYISGLPLPRLRKALDELTAKNLVVLLENGRVDLLPAGTELVATQEPIWNPL